MLHYNPEDNFSENRPWWHFTPSPRSSWDSHQLPKGTGWNFKSNLKQMYSVFQYCLIKRKEKPTFRIQSWINKDKLFSQYVMHFALFLVHLKGKTKNKKNFTRTHNCIISWWMWWKDKPQRQEIFPSIILNVCVGLVIRYENKMIVLV